jgi:hypothetical protein
VLIPHPNEEAKKTPENDKFHSKKRKKKASKKKSKKK